MRTSVLRALTLTQPQLAGVVTADRALALAPRTLLHAGPPLTDPTRPPAVILSSAVMTALYEGWAGDEAAAEAMVADGRITLAPAQDRGCVTPLAAVVSASTPLLRVVDPADAAHVAWAPVSTVRGADTRMGGRDPGLPARLHARDHGVARALAAVLDAGPIGLWPLAVQGLADGDDLHNRLSGANAALAMVLRARRALALADDIAATPLFFLTVWMAASALLLRSVEDGAAPTLVTRAGGNGERFGVALAGRPMQWICADALPPRGPFLPGLALEAPVCGAIGDSAVIDMLGLGGQRLALAPEPRSLVQDELPGPAEALEPTARALLAVPHPLLSGWPLGLDASRVRTGAVPIVMLAMLARDGRAGFLGRGVYVPPASVFAQAVDALSVP